jgi:WD40 repeat protein
MHFEIKKIGSYNGHKDSVYHISEGPEAGKLLSAGGDGYLVQWKSPEEGVPIAKVNHPIYAFEYIKDSDTLWVGENSEGIHKISPSAKKVETSLHLGKVSIFQITTLGEYTYVANSLGYLHVIKDQAFIKHVQVSQKSLRSIAINKAKKEMAIGTSDHQIYILDLDTLKIKYTLEGHSNSVFSVCYVNDLLLSAGRDAKIRLWDINLEYLPITEIPAHNYAINHLLPIVSKGLLATCSMDKSIKLWNLDDMRLLKVIDKGKYASHGTSVNKLWWNETSETLFSASDDRTISEWKLF